MKNPLKRMFPKFFLKNKVVMFEKRGNALILRNAYGKVTTTKDGVKSLEVAYQAPNKFMMDLTTIEPPEYSQYVLDSKGKAVLMLVSPTQGDIRTLTPLEFNTIGYEEVESKFINPETNQEEIRKEVKEVVKTGISLTVVDEGVSFWNTQEHIKFREKYWKPGFIEKYGGLVFSITAMTLIFLMIVITTQNMVKMGSELSGIASQLKNAAQIFKDAVGNINIAPPT